MTLIMQMDRFALHIFLLLGEKERDYTTECKEVIDIQLGIILTRQLKQTLRHKTNINILFKQDDKILDLFMHDHYNYKTL